MDGIEPVRVQLATYMNRTDGRSNTVEGIVPEINWLFDKSTYSRADSGLNNSGEIVPAKKFSYRSKFSDENNHIRTFSSGKHNLPRCTYATS